MLCIYFVLFFALLREVDARASRAEEAKFYMYELSERLVDTWPADNTTLTRWSIYNSTYRLNNGAGPLIDERMGMYGTWQFSLFKLGWFQIAHGLSPSLPLSPSPCPSNSTNPPCHRLKPYYQYTSASPDLRVAR